MAYLIISVIIFNAVAFLVPKRLSQTQIYIVMLFSAVSGFVTDIIFDLKYDLYGYFEKGVQYLGFLSIIGLFPAAGFLFVNFYPLNKPMAKQVTYIAGWTVFCLFYEITALLFGFFYYNGWHLWYSAMLYPVLLFLHVINIKWVKKMT